MDDDTNYSPADWRGPAARYTLTKEPPRFKTRRAGSRYAARYPSLFGDKPILDIPRPTTRCWRLYDVNSVRPKRGGWARRLPAAVYTQVRKTRRFNGFGFLAFLRTDKKCR